MILGPWSRKLALTAHVLSSVGWFGAVAAFLALAIVGMTSRVPVLVSGAYVAMGLTTWLVVVPFAFASLASGVVSSLGTKWGLVRNWWVLMKLLITAASTAVLLVHTRPVDLLAHQGASGSPINRGFHEQQLEMVIASGAALAVLVLLTVLSIYKPAGATPFAGQPGRRTDSRS